MIFIKLIWLGVGFLNRTGAEKDAKKSFIIEIIHKYLKCPALPLYDQLPTNQH